MNTFRLTLVVAVLAGVCTAQHGVDPAYLQQFYQQVAAQAGHRAAAASYADATPISEPKDDGQPQYVLPGQQLRLKDATQEQARAQVQQHTQAYVAPSVRAQYQPQPQPQQVQYVQQPQPQPQPVHYKSAPVKPLRQQQQSVQYEAAGGKLNKESPEDYDHNPSYQFGFDVKDDEFTNYQNRKEVREGNVIKGSYSVVDSDGFIRTVKYTADPKEGFKAEVIREPTDIVVKFPTPPPAQQQPQQQLFRHSAAPQQFVAQGAPQYRQEKPAQQPQYQYQ